MGHAALESGCLDGAGMSSVLAGILAGAEIAAGLSTTGNPAAPLRHMMEALYDTA